MKVDTIMTARAHIAYEKCTLAIERGYKKLAAQYLDELVDVLAKALDES